MLASSWSYNATRAPRPARGQLLERLTRDVLEPALHIALRPQRSCRQVLAETFHEVGPQCRSPAVGKVAWRRQSLDVGQPAVPTGIAHPHRGLGIIGAKRRYSAMPSTNHSGTPSGLRDRAAMSNWKACTISCPRTWSVSARLAANGRTMRRLRASVKPPVLPRSARCRYWSARASVGPIEHDGLPSGQRMVETLTSRACYAFRHPPGDGRRRRVGLRTVDVGVMWTATADDIPVILHLVAAGNTAPAPPTHRTTTKRVHPRGPERGGAPRPPHF